MRVGLHIDQQGLNFRDILAIAKLAENLGFFSVSVSDRMYSNSAKDSGTEAWNTLAPLALSTSKIKILTLVTNNLIRHPGLLAKISSSVDLMSKGRLIFGIGAGSFRKEMIDAGYSFADIATRARMLNESIQMILKLWSEDKASFNGEFFRLENAESLPKPMQKPHPPILIGGKDKTMLSLVAKYASMVDFPLYGMDPIKCREYLDDLRQNCLSIGREYDSLTKSVSFLFDDVNQKDAVKVSYDNSLPRFWTESRISGTSDEIMSKLAEYEKVGIQIAFIRFHRSDQKKELESLGPGLVKKLQK